MRIQNRTIPIRAALRMARKSYKGIAGILSGMSRRSIMPDRRWRSGEALKPAVANVEITRRCNLHCSMCWLWGSNGIGNLAMPELNAREWLSVIEDISQYVSMVYFTGGEPLIKRDLLLELVRRIKKNRRLCTITTNGTLVDRATATKLVTSGLDIVTISIDGDEEGHDSVRGKGAFRKAISGVRNLVDVRNGMDAPLPLIKTNTTINDISLSTIGSFVHQLEDIGVDVCQLQYPWFLPSSRVAHHQVKMKQIFGIECEGIKGYANDNMGRIAPNDIVETIDVFEKEMKGRFALYPDIRKIDDIAKYFVDFNYTFQKKCKTPWTNVTIKADGRVNLCPDYYISEYIIGYVNRRRLKDLWNNGKARAFRKKLEKRKSFPGCARCCGLFS